MLINTIPSEVKIYDAIEDKWEKVYEQLVNSTLTYSAINLNGLRSGFRLIARRSGYVVAIKLGLRLQIG